MEGVEGLPTEKQLREILSHVAASPRFVARCSQALEFCRRCCDGTTEVIIAASEERIFVQLHICDDDDCTVMGMQLQQHTPGDRQAGC